MKDLINKCAGLGRIYQILIGGSLFFVLLIAGTAFYSYYRISILDSEFASTTALLSERVANLEAGLATSTLTSQELSQKLLEAQIKNDSFEESISDIAGTVGTLEKLSKTDKELLQKYSRVYFLSDNYIPLSLKEIDSKYLYDNTKTLEFHTSALPFLKRLLDRARRDDIPLQIVSAYRSFGTQSTLKNSFLTTYGSGANQFSADQGYSEHQLGTALDLTQEGLSPVLGTNFESSEAFTWLTNNAYKYGFILSYPQNNTFYQYEPWHWRFVGVKLATKLHDNNMNFSDMEQRVIDTYLVKIFD